MKLVSAHSWISTWFTECLERISSWLSSGTKTNNGPHADISWYSGIQRRYLTVGFGHSRPCFLDVTILTPGEGGLFVAQAITTKKRYSASAAIEMLRIVGGPAGPSRPRGCIGLMRETRRFDASVEAYVAMTFSSICGFNQREARGDDWFIVIFVHFSVIRYCRCDKLSGYPPSKYSSRIW